MPRHATTNAAGKCVASLKTEVPEDVRDDFDAVARMHGKTRGEYLRDVVLRETYGQLHALRLRAGIAEPEGRDSDRMPAEVPRLRLCRAVREGLH